MAETSRISRPELRALLNRRLRTDSDLDAFALDYFPDTAQMFAAAMDRTQKINLLFARHDTDTILAAVESQYPEERKPTAPPPTFAREVPPLPERPAGPPLMVCLYAEAAKYDHNTYLELRKVLTPKLRAGTLTLWSPADVLAGEQLEVVRSRKLTEAAVVVLLVSADFLADPELDELVRLLLERRAVGSCVVIPLLIRASAWRSSRFGFLQPLPRDEVPISSHKDRDAVWLKVVEGLAQAIQQKPSRS